MTKRLLPFLIAGITACLGAETLAFPVFSIDVATDWKHRVEEHTLVSDERTILFITYKCDADAQSRTAGPPRALVVLRSLLNPRS